MKVKAEREAEARGRRLGPVLRQARLRDRRDGHGETWGPDVRAAASAVFGFDVGRVRVHTDARAESAVRGLGARAVTVGSDILFRGDTFAPERSDGATLLAHELSHVAQQRGGPPRLQCDVDPQLSPTPEAAALAGLPAAVRKAALAFPEVAGLLTALRAMEARQIARVAVRRNRDDNELLASPRRELIAERAPLQAQIQAVVAAMHAAPDRIAAAEVDQVADHLHAELSKSAPYYTQMHNRNILSNASNDALMRTCNITCLSMALEGLGKTFSDFQGDRALLAAIHGSLRASSGGDRQYKGELAGWRLPDVMQFVAIYVELSERASTKALLTRSTADPEGFAAVLDDAAGRAAGNMLKEDYLLRFARLFGVSGRKRKHEQESTLDTFKSKTTVKGKKVTVTRPAAEQEQLLPLEAYRSGVLQALGPSLRAGAQVIVHLNRHFVILRRMDAEHVVVDDPGGSGQGRVQVRLTWAEARENEYFKYCVVLGE